MARPRTLKSASQAGDLDAVKYHISQGADVNATTAAGHFALGGAVINGHSEVVECLIAHAMRSSGTGLRTLSLPRPKHIATKDL